MYFLDLEIFIFPKLFIFLKFSILNFLFFIFHFLWALAGIENFQI